MEHIHFARVEFGTKKVIHITPLLKQTIVNDSGEMDLKLVNDYLKKTIPDSKNDIWLEIIDSPSRSCGIDYTYDENLDAFIPPKPFDSWTLNIQTFEWESPVPKPEGSNIFSSWNEDTLSWDIEQIIEEDNN